MELKNILLKIKEELPGAIALGIIDVQSGLPLSGVASSELDLETTAAYFANALSSVLKATKVVEKNSELEEVMVVTKNFVTLFLFAREIYALGATVPSDVQLGLIRAVMKKFLPDIEKELP